MSEIPPLFSFEPRRTVWERVREDAFGKGLVHGCAALEAPRGYNWSPADACDVLAAMVDAGLLTPCKADLAGASFSVRALRTLGPSAGQHDDLSKWAPAIAHLWTYEPVRDPEG